MKNKLLYIGILAVVSTGFYSLGWFMHQATPISTPINTPGIGEAETAKSAMSESESTSTQDMPWYADYDIYPKFDEYTGTPAKPDLASNPLGYTYRTRISDAAEKGPNFSGHFTIAQWGCGTECQSSAIIDTKTGKIYNGLTSEHGIEYRLDSTLVVVNPLNWYDLNGLNGLPDWLTTRFYEWTGEKFRFLGEYKWNGSGMQQIR